MDLNSTLAYAGFSKGWGRSQEFVVRKGRQRRSQFQDGAVEDRKGEEQKKRSSLRFGPIFRPKLGEDQKKEVFT